MKCGDFELIIPVVARNRFLDLALERVMAHADDCGRCATRLVQERALAEGVEAVMASLSREEPSPQVEAALLVAFNAHSAKKAASAPVGTFVRKQRRLHLRLGFAYAVLLILISIPSVFWRRSHSPTPEQPMIAQHNGSVSRRQKAEGRRQKELGGKQSGSLLPFAVLSGDELKVGNSAGPSRRQKRVRPAVVSHSKVTRPNAAEEVTEFFPLAEGEDLTALEAAQIARVELPVSALMELGLRVGPEISPGRVKADILMAHDGSARAIRFVR